MPLNYRAALDAGQAVRLQFWRYRPARVKRSVKGMDRPISPEPRHFPVIRRAFPAARRTRWLPEVVGLVFAPIS
jgi:hypothetical protein